MLQDSRDLSEEGFVDFTTVTAWESFCAELEERLRRWHEVNTRYFSVFSRLSSFLKSFSSSSDSFQQQKIQKNSIRWLRTLKQQPATKKTRMCSCVCYRYKPLSYNKLSSFALSLSLSLFEQTLTWVFVFVFGFIKTKLKQFRPENYSIAFHTPPAGHDLSEWLKLKEGEPFALLYPNSFSGCVLDREESTALLSALSCSIGTSKFPYAVLIPVSSNSYFLPPSSFPIFC